MKDREHNGQKRYQRSNEKTQINEGQRTQWPKFEDTKGLIRRHKMKDREHNGQKDKRFNQKTQNGREQMAKGLKIPKR